MDSGATCHMCNNEKMFATFKSFNKAQEVTLGDGHVLEATGEGIVQIKMKLPNEKLRRRNLRNVLFVPKLAYNLLSVSKAAEAGRTTQFDESGCQIFNSDMNVIAVAKRVGNLYYLECQENHSLSVMMQSNERLWHRRFGHLGENGLVKLAKSGLIKSFNYDSSKEIGFCETCIGGKHQRSKFPASSTRCKEPLGLVHSDVCGKMNTASLGGAVYFLTFIDDNTRYVWIYPLKHKDEVFDRFLQWKAQVEKSSGRKLKVLRTDNGGEYTSAKFEDYLKAEGVRHERTVPKTPEQNGVAERMNRTLVETIRSMLIDSKLPHKFWAEALATATYIRNRCTTKAIDGMTPYEAWTGAKPTVKHLRVFGCDAFVHIPKDERHKLDSKSKKCILLGYGEHTKGYRLYDPERRRVLYSRDVKFNENEKKDETQESPNSNGGGRMELDFSDYTEDSSGKSQVETVTGNDSETVPRRSERQRKPPDFYGIRVNVSSEKPSEPVTIEEATACSEKAEWMQAMETEMKSLKENDVWKLVELPTGRKTVGSKWVYKVKTGAHGSVERYKARLVAQGYTQKFGTDYDETFCPVVRMESLRALLALSVQFGLQLHQVDVTTAFLNGELEEEVYMQQPKGFVGKGEEHLVCKLKKSIYGLKQSPRCWNTALDKQLKEMGFVQSTSDPCIYIDAGGDIFFIGVYVDDIILASRTLERVTEVKEALSQKFDIKDMGKLHFFLGMQVMQDKKTGDTWVGQPAYTENLLAKCGMQDSKPVSTPADPSQKLVKATDGEESVNQQQFQSIIGCLMYLSVSTRPDITYSISTLAKFTSNPNQQHWTALKRVLRYLKGTVNYGLMYSSKTSKECVGYSDADWAGDLDDRKSTSGYLFQISGGAVTWRSKKQSCVALSTAEAEYMALSSAAQEAVWLRQLTTELGSPPKTTTTIFEDNQSAICMTKNPQFHGRAKHIAIKYHFIREQVGNGTIKLKYCPTNEMLADMFTKGLSREQFGKLRSQAGIVELPTHYT